MKLQSLQIGALPGIEPGFSLDTIGAGINVIYGPNAIGKSSVLRAVHALLYPDVNHHRQVRLRATFTSEHASGASFEIDHLAGSSTWQQAGQPVTRPRLPEPRHISCYTISLETLLQAGDSEQDFHALVARELSGGYDLSAVRQAALFNLKKTHGRAESTALKDATTALRTIHDGHVKIERDASRLPDLERELTLAQQAAGQVVLLQATLNRVERETQLAQALERLQDFPPELANLTGEEPTLATSLSQEIADLERRANATVQAIGDCERVMASASIEPLEPHEERLNDLALSDQRSKLARLQSCEMRLAEQQRRRDEAAAKQQSARSNLGSSAPEQAVSTDPQSVSEVEAGLRNKRQLQAQITELQAAISQHATGESESVEALLEARNALLGWLRANPGTGRKPVPPRPPLHWLIPVVVTLLVAIAAAAALHIAFTLLLLPAAALWPLLRPRHGDETNQAQVAAVERYGRTGLTPPPNWELEAVEACLSDLDDRLVRSRETTYRERVRTEREHELAERQTALRAEEAKLDKIATRVGFSPRTLDSSFERWLRLVHDLDRAQTEQTAVDLALENLRREHKRLSASLKAFLVRYGLADAPQHLEVSEIGHRISELEKQLKTHLDAARDLEQAKLAQQQVEAELQRAKARRQALYAKAGMSNEDERALANKVELLQDWHALVDEKKRIEGSLDELHKAWRAAPAPADDKVRQAIEQRDPHDVTALLTDFSEQAAKTETLTAEKARIETLRASARKERRLEAARAARDDAKSQLEERLQEACLADAGLAILEEVEREHHARNEPDILRRADHWLRVFTEQAYELRFQAAAQESPGHNGFYAFDTRSGVAQPLEKLSTGTRMQLVLALRLAFTEHIEQGTERLPIFLDEVLGTADPLRYRAIVKAVSLIAQQNDRQIFYLTAQPHEVNYWHEAGAIHAIDLASVRGQGTAIGNAATVPDLPTRPVVPPADGMSAYEYAVAIGADRLQPFARIDSIHLVHILSDRLDILEQALRHQIERAGTARSVLEGPDADVLLSREQATELQWRLAVLATWQEAWREGRGRPLDAAQLATCDAITPTFRPRLGALLDELNGDAAALLKVIDERSHKAVKRFGNDNRGALEEWLRAEGYLDSRPTLGEGALFHRVIAALAPEIKAGVTTPGQIQALLDSFRAGIAGHATEPLCQSDLL